MIDRQIDRQKTTEIEKYEQINVFLLRIIYMYVYIYIYREREREGKEKVLGKKTDT